MSEGSHPFDQGTEEIAVGGPVFLLRGSATGGAALSAPGGAWI
jgi:hypothetical protein